MISFWWDSSGKGSPRKGTSKLMEFHLLTHPPQLSTSTNKHCQRRIFLFRVYHMRLIGLIISITKAKHKLVNSESTLLCSFPFSCRQPFFMNADRNFCTIWSWRCGHWSSLPVTTFAAKERSLERCTSSQTVFWRFWGKCGERESWELINCV